MMPDDLIPDYAQRVLVPIANPANAPVLLELGNALVDRNEGELIALFVSLGDIGRETKMVAEITPIVRQLQDDGIDARLVIQVATSPARGIIDAAREENVDLIVLGLRHQERSHAILGSIVEHVVTTSPADVLIYRAAVRERFINQGEAILSVRRILAI